MFGYSLGELGSILAMQGFAGLILFSVYLLMALGLAIIFGQMGVINMAHGEFMILGAYMTYFCSHLFASYLPGLYAGYFFVAVIVAFIASETAELLKEIIKNRSVIVIEHDMKFVESIAHRVTVMHQGKVLAEGDMQSVQNNPKVKEVSLGTTGASTASSPRRMAAAF